MKRFAATYPAEVTAAAVGLVVAIANAFGDPVRSILIAAVGFVSAAVTYAVNKRRNGNGNGKGE